MTTIHIVQSGSDYVIDERRFGDEAGLMLSLRARGVTDDHSMQALEGFVREGCYTIEHE